MRALGTHFVAVDTAGAIKKCASCGVATDKPLWFREHSCPACGFEMDRTRDITGRRLGVDAWLNRMDVPSDRCQQIRSLIADAPALLAEQFDCHYDGDRLASYRTGVVLVQATVE